jgi:hypothetical protein
MSLLLLFDGRDTAYVPASDINVYTRRTIHVQFTNEVVVDSTYYDPNNYTVSLVEGTGPVEVVSVLPTNETTTLGLVIVTQPMTQGTTYNLAITNMFNREGGNFSLIGDFVYRDTKSDSSLRSVPKHFDKRETSLIASLVTAITISDDVIGGSRNDILVVEGEIFT